MLLFGGLILVLLIEYLGLAELIPILRASKFTTLFSALLVIVVLFRFSAVSIVEHVQSRLLVTFIVFTALSVLWAYISTYAVESITPHAGYFGLFVLIFYLIDRVSRASHLAVVYMLVAIVVVLSNLSELTSGARVSGYQAGYFLSDGNDFGWALCIFLPFGLYLLLSKQSLLARGIGLLGASLCMFGIVATQSRGAALAVVAAAAFFWAFVARRKVLGAVVVGAALAGILQLAPGGYVGRMQTIQNYEEDGSAMGRVYAWRAAGRMAIEHPLGVGAGNFNTAYGRFYRVDGGPVRWISAHSVYFKVLGEYGFGGLAIILFVLYRNLADNAQTRRLIVANPRTATLSEYWPGMLNMSLVGYAVAGMFLGGVMYPHLYMLTALTLSAKRITQLDVSRNEVLGPAAQPQPASILVSPIQLRPPSPSRALWPLRQARSKKQQLKHGGGSA